MEEFEVELRDGTRALLRPIRPDDKERLQEGLRQLSSRSRYLRFHAPVARLTERQLRYFTEVDYHDHMAWLAVNADEPKEPGMGVARYVRLVAEPTVAEAAVTVLDRYQGRGIGTLLLNVLAASAIGNGIRTFRNYVLAENTAMLDIFDELGGARVSEGGGVYRVDVALPERPPSITADTGVREVLRAVARQKDAGLQWSFPYDAVPARPPAGAGG